ncbi:MAG: hypothetical protein ACP5M9_01990 [Candidatus Micrarchaeia archaeon]
MRGKEPLVTCDSCGRKMPRNKGVIFEKVIRYVGDPSTQMTAKFMSTRKLYYCISCAKHRGIFEKKKAAAQREAKRNI